MSAPPLDAAAGLGKSHQVTSSRLGSRRSDVIVIGAGILGLAHAAVARRRGLSVTVLERDARAAGASVRNFGHVCTTAQPAELRALAESSRFGWLRAAGRYGLAVRTCGTLVLADRPEALAVLDELARARPDDVAVLTRAQVARATGGLATDAIAGGALLPNDLRVDPRTTAAALADALAADGVEFRWRHQVNAVEDRGDRVAVATNRGVFAAERVIGCLGHDLEQLAAPIADAEQLRRCWLTMFRLAPAGAAIDPAVLTVSSMLRYGAFAEVPAFAELAASVRAERPALIASVANVMTTQLPDSSLLCGDSHDYGETPSPFQPAAIEELLVAELARQLRVGELPVIERWQGVYADSTATDIVDAAPTERVRYLTVASGIGMTLSFGLAERTFAN